MINERIAQFETETRNQVIYELQAMAVSLRLRDLLPEIRRDHAAATEQRKVAEKRVQEIEDAIKNTEVEDKAIVERLVKLGNNGTYLFNVRPQDTPQQMNNRRRELKFERENLFRELRGEHGAEKALVVAQRLEADLVGLENRATSEPCPNCQLLRRVLHEVLQGGMNQ